MSIREKLKQLGLTQVDLILALKERGITTNPSELSYTLSGVATYPKTQRILAECERYLDEYERKTNRRIGKSTDKTH